LTPLPWWPILVALWLENCRTVLLLEGQKNVSRAAPVGRFDGFPLPLRRLIGRPLDGGNDRHHPIPRQLFHEQVS
jgi:hypothetical protein